jgi:hypothetical protein
MSRRTDHLHGLPSFGERIAPRDDSFIRPARSDASRMRGRSPISGTSRSVRRRVRWETPTRRSSTRAMLKRVPTRTGVVPFESFVDIRGAADIVSRWIAVASEDIHESSADALHCESQWDFSRQRERLGILRQRAPVGPEVRRCCTVQSSTRPRKVTSDFAASRLRRDSLRISDRSLMARRRRRRRPSRSSREARAKAGMRSAFAAAPLRRDRLRTHGELASGTSARVARRPSRSSREARAKAGWVFGTISATGWCVRRSGVLSRVRSPSA